MQPITVYTKKGCSRCASAKNQLTAMGVQFSEVTIGVDVDRSMVMEMFPGVTGLPILVQSGEVITIEDLK